MLVMSCVAASAQRTASGSSCITVNGLFTVPGLSFGGEVDYSRYMLNGYWFAGASVTNRGYVDNVFKTYVDHQRAAAVGGIMFRLVSSYNRFFSLYGGVDAFAGVGMLDLFKTMPENARKYYLENGHKEVSFIYGGSPRLEMEFYLSELFALTVVGRVPFCGGSGFDWVSLETGVGVRFNF